MANVRQLLDDLAGSLLFDDHQSMVGSRSISIGEKQPDRQQLTRRARKTSFQALLSHRHDENLFSRMSVFDQLYAKSYELKLRRDDYSLEDADSLVSLVGKVKDSEPTVDAVNVLRLLFALADTGGVENWPRTSFRRPSDYGSITSISKGEHAYEQFPRKIFHCVDSLVLRKGLYEHFDPKLFEQCPGFASANSKLSCHRFCSPLSNTVAPTLYGALSLPLKDSWQLDVRMDFPELLEESPAPRLPLEPYRELAFSTTMQRFVPSLAVDEDEGFVETTETPSSACSFGRTADFGDVFAAILEKDGSDVEFMKPRYTTWESHGSYDIPREKPLLSEAGERAVDEVIVCLHQELSLVNPDFHPVCHVTVSVADLYRDAINVLIGIPSRCFKYDQESCSFSMAPVTVSGLSGDTVSGLLKNFADSGRAYRRLEAACQSAKVASESLVQKALFEAVGCYLRHYQKFVLDLPRQIDGRLLHLSEATSKFRRQICLIPRLCSLDGNYVGDQQVFRQLPRGVRLLRHLYDAFESIPSGSAVDDRIVLLSFFVAACKPYIQYVRSWAFEGRLLDSYNEFPIVRETDFLLQRDEQFWKKSLRLAEDASDPLLGSFSTSMFVCGKSLHLLRLCCPQHHLFTSTVKAPSLEIAFSEARQKELVSIGERYYVAIKTEVDRLALSRELNRLLHERDKEELFRQAQMVTRLSLMQQKRKLDRRREAYLAKKRHLMADLKSQMEVKKADLVNTVATTLGDEVLGESTLISTLKEVTSTLSKLSVQDVMPESTGIVMETTLLDSNMNPAITEDIHLELDPNDNADVTARCDEITWRQNAVSSVVVVTDGDDDPIKGVKRKQDRDSIDFDTGGMARRHPSNVPEPSVEHKVQMTMPSAGVRNTDTRHGGVLVVGSTFIELRSRGRSAHGHSSDSTIQKLMYGNLAAILPRRSSPTIGHRVKSSEDVRLETDIEACLSVPVFTNLRVQPYAVEFDQLNQLPMTDIFKSPDLTAEKRDDDISPDALFRLPLFVVLQKCLTAPLSAQISCVDSCLLDYFLVTLRAEEHLMALRNYFFMQDGEFGQMLSDLLFERLSVTSIPNELLNPVVLNPILAGALALSSAENHFSQNVGFVVKFMPESFHQNSPSALNCLQLSYRVDWPLNILISSDDLAHYERIFSFVLLMRRCMWSLGNVCSLLKDLDAECDLTSSPQFRSLQFFRHEMLHFIRSLYEYIGVQAFQTTWFHLRQQIAIVRNLDELIAAHSKYLRHVSFRCLLHKKAVPVMKIVQDLFAIVLKFRSQLLSASWRRNSKTNSMEVESFPQLCSSFVSFRDHSTFLYKVISKLARRGYQTHLMEFSLNLDFNGYYSSLAAQIRDESLPSLYVSASDNQFI